MNENTISPADVRKRLPYQKLRFRQTCPSGRMVLNPLRLTDQLAIFEAKVFLRRDDPTPAGSFTANKTAQETPAYIRAAQEEALSEALDNAGFGVQSQTAGQVRRTPAAPPSQKAAPAAHTQANQSTAQTTPAAQAQKAAQPVSQDARTKATPAPVPQPKVVEPSADAAISAQTGQPLPGEAEGGQERARTAPSLENTVSPTSPSVQTRQEPKPEPAANPAPRPEPAAPQPHSAEVAQEKGTSSVVDIITRQPVQEEPQPEEQPKAAPGYTEDMTVEEICKWMTLEEARQVVVTKGTCGGWTMAQVAEKRPSRLCRPIAERLMEQGCVVAGVPGFYVNGYGEWTVKFYTRTSGILIPLHGVDGKLQGLQIRLDRPLRDENDPPDRQGAKYLPLTSTGKDQGVSAGTPVHFVGDPHARVVYVTEGSLKADIAHALTGRTFAATIGANNPNGLDELFAFLHRNGTEEIIEALDMDKRTNPHVAQGAAGVCRLALKHGLQCRPLVWNPDFKGIDDWQLAVRKQKQFGQIPQSISAQSTGGDHHGSLFRDGP